jgi:hypothetical protein
MVSSRSGTAKAEANKEAFERVVPNPAALPLRIFGIRIDFDIRADRIGIVLQVVRRFQDVLLLDVLHALDLHLLDPRLRHRLLDAAFLGDVAAQSARTRLFRRLLGAAFWETAGARVRS